jgi:hypothetical protein
MAIDLDTFLTVVYCRVADLSQASAVVYLDWLKFMGGMCLC